jgi:hypothetical protein
MPTVGNKIPADPREWTLSDVDAALEAALEPVGGKTGYSSNLAYLGGDHVQDLLHFRGPGRDSAGNIRPADAKKIKSAFVAIPEAEKCIERRVTGACGIEADFKINPREPAGPENEDGTRQASDEQLKEAQEIAGPLGEWWRAKNYWAEQKQCVRLACIAPQACLRIFINPAGLEDATTAAGSPTKRVRQRPFAEALNVIECVAEWPAGCGVYTDPDTRQKIGIWRGKDREDMDIAEVWFVDGDGRTVLRRVTGKEGAVEEKSFPWGGLLPIIPLEIRPLLTEPVRQIQAALDSSATGLMRNIQSHNYTQRDELGLVPAGTWYDYPPASGTQQSFISRVVDGKTWYLHEEARELGNGVTNSLQPNLYTSEINEKNGTERFSVTPGSVTYHNPSDPALVITGVDYWKQTLRDACHQGHIADGSTAEASGDAYEQKRAEYVDDVENVGLAGVRPQTEKALTVAVVMAKWIEGAGEATFPTLWTVDANVVTNPGPVSADKIRSNNESVTAGTKSLATALQDSGVQDVPGEVERINLTRTLDILKKRIEVANLLRDGGADPVEAYKVAGFTDEEAVALGRTDGGFTQQ